MNGILNKLKEAGVHSIKSDGQIILEILEDNLIQADLIDNLIYDLLIKTKYSSYKKVLLECPRIHLVQLKRTMDKMKIIGERVIYKRSLGNSIDIEGLDYDVWSITEKNSLSFLSEVMDRNMDDVEKFLMSMRTELPLQVQKMYTIYKVDNDPIGVVFPHLEPDKDNEGRIFWIGIHPKFRGKGLGKNLHRIGLYRLKNDFKAKSYLGATEINNNSMRKIMTYNGCLENQNTVISLAFSNNLFGD
ncbi:GNAT family N-acetyltransferase [Ornithinibacillus scapharcae]|uniref:GNAT family N-acetyltransferase n=1 Tax=Ornithinibacillus scapharcae TaxID=1147159 RepID=UPI000225AFD4|nr:GNAT family N-acetyltransferase [Ornithinibacillus scapharcae]